MAWYRRFSESLLGVLERSGRMRALSALRNLDPKILREAGISPDLMDKGIDAWPWRSDAADAPLTPKLSVSLGSVPEQDHGMNERGMGQQLGRHGASNASAIGSGLNDDIAA